MSLERAKEYLKKFGLENKVIEFNVSLATVKEAAKVLNCKEDEIAKTLAFTLEDKPILIVVAGDVKIDNAKYKREFKVKSKMISSENVKELIGYAVGGVCPFGVEKGIDIYFDKSLKKSKIIYPACGSFNSVIKLTLDELEKIVDFKKWVDVCKEK